MAYGLEKPPITADAGSFQFKEWFASITKYVMSRVGIKNTTIAITVDNITYYQRVDATGGARTITLPPASACPGREILICKIDSSGNAVTVSRSGTDTIEGSTTISLAAQWNKALLISNGNTGWERIV